MIDISVTRSPVTSLVWTTSLRTWGSGVELPTVWRIGPEYSRATIVRSLSLADISRFCSPGTTNRYRPPTASSVMPKNSSASRLRSDNG